MSEVKIGDLIKDNDPRMPGRFRRVRRFEGHGVIAEGWGQNSEVRISLSRIFTDGKPRRTGWSLIPQQP
jgi:hypothetical protein